MDVIFRKRWQQEKADLIDDFKSACAATTFEPVFPPIFQEATWPIWLVIRGGDVLDLLISYSGWAMATAIIMAAAVVRWVSLHFEADFDLLCRHPPHWIPPPAARWLASLLPENSHEQGPSKS